jgi:hypothetical protein
LFFSRSQLTARPVDGFGGVRVKTFEVILGGAVFIVVALDAGDVHLADDLEAFLGIGVVAHNVAEADDVRGVLGADVFQHDLESFQIAVNVCDDGVFHFLANDLKSPKFIFSVGPSYLFVADKSSKTCIMDGRAKRFEFGGCAFGDEFHATVGEIADGAGDFKTGDDGFGGVAEADALHASGIKHGHPAAGVGGVGLRHGGIKPKVRPGSNVF